MSDESLAEPDYQRSNHRHGPVVGGAPFEAGGDPTPLLEPVDAPLDHVASPVDVSIDGGLAPGRARSPRPLVDAIGNDMRNVPAAQESTAPLVGVALVGDEEVVPLARPTPPCGHGTRIASSKASSWVLSWRSPGVRTTASGRPLPPQARCSLVVSPRSCARVPRPSVRPLLTRPRRMLVRAYDRAVDAHLPDHCSDRIGLGLDVGEQAVPRPVPLPAHEPRVDGPPGTIPLAQVAPGRSSTPLAEDAVERRAMIVGGMTGTRSSRRERGREEMPLPIG